MDPVCEFFINGTRKAVIIFKESMGAFWYDRYKAVAEALLNLGISILLVLKCGVLECLQEPLQYSNDFGLGRAIYSVQVPV